MKVIKMNDNLFEIKGDYWYYKIYSTTKGLKDLKEQIEKILEKEEKRG